MRTSLRTLLEVPLDHHSRLQHPRDQRQNPLIPYLAPNQLEDQSVGNLIKEALQVDRDAPLMAVCDRLSYVLDGHLLTLASTKPEVG